MKGTSTVLVVDDEDFVRDSLEEVLVAKGFRVLTATGGEEAAGLLQSEDVDAVVTDLRMPEGDGQSLLRAARDGNVSVPIIVLTGAGTVSDAVTAMRTGAYDLIEKPVDAQRLVRILTNAIERSELRSEVRGLREALRRSSAGRRWVGRSEAARTVLTAIERAGDSRDPVLVTGEVGTGKEVVAYEVHRAGSRRSRAIVRVPCATTPAASLPALLFGRGRQRDGGSRGDRLGSVALAQGGTLLLVEVGALPEEAQLRLLGLLESGTYVRVGEERSRVVDVRVIATSTADLAQAVAEGTFREDLYWRLNVLPIAVPPLRARTEDLEELCTVLLRDLALRDDDATVAALAPNALSLLAIYSWPGNVRELLNVLERCLRIAEGRPIDAGVVARALDPSGPTEEPGDAASDGADLRIRSNLDALERRLILEALRRTSGRRAEAAGLLGVDPRNLAYYFRKHGLGETDIDEVLRG